MLGGHQSPSPLYKSADPFHLFIAQALLIRQDQNPVAGEIGKTAVEDDVEWDFRLDQGLLEEKSALIGTIVVEGHGGIGVEHGHVGGALGPPVIVEPVAVEANIAPLRRGRIGYSWMPPTIPRQPRL